MPYPTPNPADLRRVAADVIADVRATFAPDPVPTEPGADVSDVSDVFAESFESVVTVADPRTEPDTDDAGALLAAYGRVARAAFRDAFGYDPDAYAAACDAQATDAGTDGDEISDPYRVAIDAANDRATATFAEFAPTDRVAFAIAGASAYVAAYAAALPIAINPDTADEIACDAVARAATLTAENRTND